MNCEVAVPLPGGGDGQVEFDGIDDFGAGATVSALWEPSQRTRVGTIWIQEIELDLAGDVNLVGLGATANITSRIPFAQSVRASVVHELSPRLWLGASFRWEDWSGFEKPWVTVSGFKTQLDRWSDASPWTRTPGARWGATPTATPTWPSSCWSASGGALPRAAARVHAPGGPPPDYCFLARASFSASM